jgi:hypothetical protein
MEPILVAFGGFTFVLTPVAGWLAWAIATTLGEALARGLDALP